MLILSPLNPLFYIFVQDLVKYDFQGIVSDELKNLKESSQSYSSKISNSVPCSDDLLWDYNGLHNAYQGECEEMMLEMQRIFYEDLRVESTRQGKQQFFFLTMIQIFLFCKFIFRNHQKSVSKLPSE